MLISYKRGQGSIVLRLKILNSSITTGAGLTGLTFASSGLIISTIADNEATATAYTQAGSTIQTVTTLGTYAAPSASNCRFREVDATNHKGVYEIQIADARFAVSSAKSLIVSISGATNAAETDVVIPLRDLDPYDAVRAGLTSLANAVAGASGGLPVNNSGLAVKADVDTIKTQAVTCAGGVTVPAATLASTTNVTAGAITTVGSVTGNVGGNVVGSVGSLTLTQAIPTSNTAQTLGDCLNAARAQGFGKWAISGTTLTLYASDGTTAVRTFTLDSASAPTTRT